MIHVLKSRSTLLTASSIVRTSVGSSSRYSQTRTYSRTHSWSKDASGGAISVLPTKLPFGEQAPRFPHTLGLPLVSRPLFPGLVTSVTLTDEATIDAMEALTKNQDQAYVSCFLRKKNPTGVSEGGVILATPEVITDPSDIYHVGTFAQIQRLTRGDETAATLILLAHRRLDLEYVDKIGPPIDVTVKHWNRSDYTGADDTIRALSNEIISTIREVAQVNMLFRENLQYFPMRVDANDPFRLADFAASISASGTPEDLQAVLEEKDAEMRLHKALVLLNREREVSKLQQEISQKVEERMTEAQRKYFLTEQLKSIKKELGMERDDKDTLIEKYRKTLSEYPHVPEEAMETIDAELEKFSTLEKNSPEYNVTRSYLDWLTSVPWGVETEENFDIQKARKTLDRDHYGLDDVKDTILEFIAIGKLRGSVQGKILCLSGPPGTGKTSIAKSVADALGRQFFRFSVGGLSDVSEIKGHRRTYIGAMPGKLIQCLKATGTTNPVVLIDEIDKLGTGFRGDPASALLEVLDPGQNSTFRDYFLDVPVDISKVLFICTANELERIPGPLLDRMEVIRLSGYDLPEKVAIAEQYLVPKSMRDSGLLGVPETLKLTIDAVRSLARWYAREAGVRNLAKYIDRITRKLALQVVAESEGATLTDKSSRKSNTWEITEDNLHEYVGKPVFTSDRLYEDGPLPHGIVMGLAYTSMGGSALYIETQSIRRGLDSEGKTRGGGTLKVTGQLGDVMKESTQIASTVARARLSDIKPESNFFDINDIHMHVPEGATPKDGPSAGVTMVTSMLSLALDRPIRNDLAMTGEVSLTGKVLAVGGIKEKIMGARRAGIKCVILPAANKRDYDEIPDYLKEDLEVHYADTFDKVYEVAFSSVDST
ncbi:predicted protein [Phaeodactylum tricornutum CCAP 1055/1]|uniref:Lon protease homolog, mitochondrial n=3 Tax=Phaeodactylum tricornutum TaxID=2850 RepID=LONM_PHATC|nr:predicted protein [Phaeodactylum tricornutum CCAP 1055/1]B7FSL4.1 RecName: Full=Lon protease homolog, mitochondrial; Flags: Precursor [Phaeodactylum tricornutum CCAP 1055/1]EEC50499.1 predicted protein [Phaeodactylum tricornutum CCAP 1055/1]|eukprot:XP_002177685.1 predicted protein [Phaeodactylum tricornutum CCAP 1055/1]